jgi:hypothetical protein
LNTPLCMWQFRSTIQHLPLAVNASVVVVSKLCIRWQRENIMKKMHGRPLEVAAKEMEAIFSYFGLFNHILRNDQPKLFLKSGPFESR